MADKKPWYKDREFRKLQKEWYSKLADADFYDIEGGVEGHLLKGSSSTVSLRSYANKPSRGQGLSNDYALREFDEVADEENEDLNFSEGGKARYFHHADCIATQAIREGRFSDERCFAWTFHAQGDGERVIADLLGVSRAKIRKHIAVLRENIMSRLDNEYR